MKKILFIAMLFLPLVSSGQKAATAEQQADVIEKITAASKSMKTMVCNFTQTREMTILKEKIISQGKMYYSNDNRLRWEYSQPFNALVINGKKMGMVNERGKTAVSGGMAYLFKGISDVMINGISGKNLTDKKRFDIEFYINKNTCNVVLTPKQAQMKKAFSQITIIFSTKDYLAQKVIMNEANGNSTVIELTDKQLNTPISDNLFAI